MVSEKDYGSGGGEKLQIVYMKEAVDRAGPEGDGWECCMAATEHNG